MTETLDIRQMRRDEVDELVDWAALEGWNPGLHDADIFWENDSEAFLAAEQGGKVIGGGAITSYAGQYGFMGFFIVKPEHRGRGLGDALWHARRDQLLQRLKDGAAIGMDGVFDMQDYYAKGGFVFSHRNLRYRAEINSDWASIQPSPHLHPLSDLSWSALLDYDLQCFGAPRERFLRAWIAQPGSTAIGYMDADTLQGFGVLRPCREGAKIGPLFADNAEIADAIFTQLAAAAAGGPVFLDAPENNPDALGLVNKYGMDEVFGCARMYLGEPPAVAERRVFGISTFELG
ncbi:MAG: GNAT family N-acetyltransferase [Pseudomonadota bacterium]